MKARLPGRLDPRRRRRTQTPPGVAPSPEPPLAPEPPLDPVRIEAARDRLRRETPPVTDEGVREVAIRGDMIRLGQLLKLAGVVDSGGELKALLAHAQVSVNGELDARRGRQLHRGDVVRIAGDELRVV